jgi:hypothetical protein
MAETFKVLGQAAPASTQAVLYQVPAGTSTTISSIVVCNQASSVGTFSVRVNIANAADGNAQLLFASQSIDGNATFVATLGITLGALDVIKVTPSSSTMSFNLFGVEVV